MRRADARFGTDSALVHRSPARTEFVDCVDVEAMGGWAGWGHHPWERASQRRSSRERQSTPPLKMRPAEKTGGGPFSLEVVPRWDESSPATSNFKLGRVARG